MANYDGSLEAVDCHIHSVRYDMVLESRYGAREQICLPSQMPHQVTLSGHLDAVATLIYSYIKSFSSGIYPSLLS
eukprot:scaffold8451_cov78-Skeletonema_dohrnii-CCMP3373.AAC.2